nr:manganese efflux pump MntP family protein [uncultured Gemmiger sp.]
MSLADLFIIALGLSMDAFAVSICKGLSVRKMQLRHALICGVWFGAFQALMPLLGYWLGSGFAGLIGSFGHWVAFVLLAIIGVNMIRESFGGEEEVTPDFSPKAMLPLAVATSIDALAVGVSFAATGTDIVAAVLFIGIVTLVVSAAGVKIGNLFGTRYKALAERAGGAVLVLMGLKILLQGLGIL